MKLKRGLVTMAGEGYDEKGRKRFTLVLVVYRLASCLSKKGLKRRSPTFFWRGLEQKGPKMLYHEAKREALMRKIIDVTIDGTGKPVFSSDYDALKGLNLYQRVFVTLMFEQDLAKVRKWMFAIQLLGLADVSSCKRPELSMSMFENTVDELQQSCENFKKHFGGNLNFKIAGV